MGQNRGKAWRPPKVALLMETSTEFGRGVLRGVFRYARLHGPWSIYVSPGHFLRALPTGKSWDGDGIIARIRSAAMAKTIHKTGLPVVASSLNELPNPQPMGGFCEIRTDPTAIARLATTHLLEQGLRNFAFCGYKTGGWSIGREGAFKAFLAEKGFSCRIRRQRSGYIHGQDWIETWEHEQPGLVKWLSALPKPVGLMACNDLCGREVLQACAAGGMLVPDDVTVVGVDNDEFMCELSDTPLSSVALNLEQSGYEAASILDARMSGHMTQKRIVMVEATGVVTRRSSQAIAHKDRLVSAALRFIQDHSGQGIGVPDVVDEVKVSRRTLERRFFLGVGSSVAVVITRSKLERAKRLLAETDLPVHRVAVASGFQNTVTFNRLFREAEGETPRRFRERAAVKQPMHRLFS